MQEHVLKATKTTSNWQTELMKPEIKDIFTTFQSDLQKIFKFYANYDKDKGTKGLNKNKSKNNFTKIKKEMSLDQLQAMLKDLDIFKTVADVDAINKMTSQYINTDQGEVKLIYTHIIIFYNSLFHIYLFSFIFILILFLCMYHFYPR